MANQHGESYMYTFEAVREKAPSASGVYTIYTPRRWVFVGESEDIRLSLFRHLNDENASMTRFGPLSFSFELVPPADRVPRQKALIAELEPECAVEDMASAQPRASSWHVVDGRRCALPNETDGAGIVPIGRAFGNSGGPGPKAQTFLQTHFLALKRVDALAHARVRHWRSKTAVSADQVAGWRPGFRHVTSMDVWLAPGAELVRRSLSRLTAEHKGQLYRFGQCKRGHPTMRRLA